MDSRSQDTLAELLLDWEEAFGRGEEIPAAVLAREHPDLAAALEARIRGLKRAGWLDAGGDPGDRPEHRCPPDVRERPALRLARTVLRLVAELGATPD